MYTGRRTKSGLAVYSNYGKKRSLSARTLAVYRPYKSPYKKRKFIPGVDRTGGYYNRFGRDGELKFFDSVLIDAEVAAAGTITDSLNHITQGTAEEQRDGRKCTIKSINCRYVIGMDIHDAQALPQGGDTCRFIIFLDKQCNGQTATVADILEDADHNSFRNLSNTNRFVILCDKLHNIEHQGMASDGAGLVSQAGVNKSYTFYKAVDIPIEFSGTDGLIAEIRSNNIGVLLISAASTAFFDGLFRLRFSG